MSVCIRRRRLLPERFESDETSPHHNGKVAAAARDHFAHTDKAQVPGVIVQVCVTTITFPPEEEAAAERGTSRTGLLRLREQLGVEARRSVLQPAARREGSWGGKHEYWSVECPLVWFWSVSVIRLNVLETQPRTGALGCWIQLEVWVDGAATGAFMGRSVAVARSVTAPPTVRVELFSVYNKEHVYEETDKI